MDESYPIVRRPLWSEDDLKLVCGIANAGGGRLIVTASEPSKRGNFRKQQKTFEAIPLIAQRELGITCTTEPIMDGMDLCLEVIIPAAQDPISYHSNYYIYTNGTNKIISKAELNRLSEKNESTGWEDQLRLFMRYEDLDPDVLSILRADPSLGDEAHSSDDRGVINLLESYGVVDATNAALTNTGVLLLHKKPHELIPGAFVQIGFFNADGEQERSGRPARGPLTKQLEGTLALLMEEHPSFGTAEGTYEPLSASAQEALREALLNALVHKDYQSGIPVNVSVYPDRIAINNVGRPPRSWTMEDLLGSHTSRPNNPALAFTLKRRGRFHGWGNGIQLMIQKWAQNDLPAPIFDLRADEMSVTFPFEESASPASQKRTPAKRIPQTEPPTRAATKSNPDHATFKERSIAAANRLDMTSTDEYILKVIETNGRVTAVRIAAILGVSESTVRRSFRRLRELGFIERIGSDKAGYWRITD